MYLSDDEESVSVSSGIIKMQTTTKERYTDRFQLFIDTVFAAMIYGNQDERRTTIKSAVHAFPINVG